MIIKYSSVQLWQTVFNVKTLWKSLFPKIYSVVRRYFVQSEKWALYKSELIVFPEQKKRMPYEVINTYLSHKNPTVSCIHYQHKLEHIYQAEHHLRHHKPCIHIVQMSAEIKEKKRNIKPVYMYIFGHLQKKELEIWAYFTRRRWYYKKFISRTEKHCMKESLQSVHRSIDKLLLSTSLWNAFILNDYSL